MNKQKWFNQIAPFLLRQNQQSMSVRQPVESYGTTCKYRGDNGLKCAIGCVIPDELYHPDLEGFDAKTILGFSLWGQGRPNKETVKKLQSYFEIDSAEDCEFFDSMQEIHDDHVPAEWFQLLVGFAETNNLNSDCIEEFKKCV